MNLDAVIFDLDGLLIDTESHSQRAFHQTAEAYGLEGKTGLFLSLVGTNEESHTTRLAEELEPDIDSISFRRDWTESFHQSMAQQPPALLAGVSEMLEWLQSNKIKSAVATSSKTVDGEKKLVEAGIRDYFDVVVCGDQVSRSKPNPDIYIKAAESLGADNKLTVGFEDSANGVRAAHAAGLNVIQIPNLVAPSPDLLKIGHTVCDSMNEALELLQYKTLPF